MSVFLQFQNQETEVLSKLYAAHHENKANSGVNIEVRCAYSFNFIVSSFPNALRFFEMFSM